MSQVLSLLKGYSRFNADLFEQLCSDTTEATAYKILGKFFENLKSSETQMMEALAADDSESVWKICHKLSGSAELLGFKYFGDYSRELSHQIKASRDLDQFQPELKMLCKDIKDISNVIVLCFPFLNLDVS